MGKRGPEPAPSDGLYAFAHQLYWDFRRLGEGMSRRRYDEKTQRRLVQELEETNLELSDAQRVRAVEVAEEEIRTGQLKESDKTERIRQIEDGQRFITGEVMRLAISHASIKHLKVLGEPDVLKELLRAQTPEAVREICTDAENWPVPPGSVLPYYLTQYAEQFVSAKREPRFPRSDRPTNQLKQLWFLARALAGAIYEVSTRTAINLVGSMRPEQMFEVSRDAKPARKQMRSKRRSRQKP